MARHSHLYFASHLFDVDVQSIAIDRTVGFEVEDHADSVAAQRLLKKHVFNRVNGVLVRLVPEKCKLAIMGAPAIDSFARDSGSLGGVRDCAVIG